TVAQAVDHLRRELEDRTAAGLDLPPGPPLPAWTPDRAGLPLPAGGPVPGPGGGLAPAGLAVPDDPGSLVTAPPAGPGAPSGTATGWTGPRYVVLVDDYDLLPAAAGSPLLPLLDLLGLGRELGFHLVLARRVAGAARAAFEPVFQRLRELGGAGLVMSGDPGEGPLVGGQRADALPPGRGFFVRPPRPTTLVQVAYRPPPAPSRHPLGPWGG
ncbi:MAG TPA: hypothetical protein VG673_22430, partial [Actinomycetota bacterium]|nr:hypothetical protein [Actinomycetota bacterium]